MRRKVVASMMASQLLFASHQALAAAPEPMNFGNNEVGSFAGARLRLALGGTAAAAKPRLSLSVTPTLRSQDLSGTVRTRFGEGVALDLTGDRTVRFSLAGRPLNALAFLGSQTDIDKSKTHGISTTGAIAIGVGAVVLVGGFLLFQAASCNQPFEPCD